MKKSIRKQSVKESKNNIEDVKKPRKRKTDSKEKSAKKADAQNSKYKENKTRRRKIPKSGPKINASARSDDARQLEQLSSEETKLLGNLSKSQSKKTNQNLMPESGRMEAAVFSVQDDFEYLWNETERYIDDSTNFDSEVWCHICDAFKAGTNYKEKLVAKCVNDGLPKRYNMSQGEFFGVHMQLRPYEVSKLVRRNEVRTALDSEFLDSEEIRNSLLDKIAALINEDVSKEFLVQQLNNLYEANDFAFPTVVQFESRVRSKLAEESSLKKLQSEHDAYLNEYDIHASEPEVIEQARVGQNSTDSTTENKMFQSILEQLRSIQQTLKTMTEARINN